MRTIERRIRYVMHEGHEILADDGWLSITALERREADGRTADWDMLFVWRAYNKRVRADDRLARRPEGVLVRVTIEVEPGS